MDSRLDLFRLAASGVGAEIAAYLYCATGIDMTYPTHVYASVTHACNSRCVMCDVWRDQDAAEIPARFWIEALRVLRSNIRTVKVSFSGGEVLLKEDIFEIFQACRDAGIPFGMTTNGILLSQENVRRFLECQPMDLSISLDSLDPVIYRAIRGTSSLERVLENIEFLLDYRKRTGSHLKVSLKTVVNGKNLRELPALAAFARQVGVAGITFDPIKRRREPFVSGTISEFEEVFSMDLDSLTDVINELTRMKRAGYPIMNSEENMLQWLHYAHPEAQADHPCTVPLKTLCINRFGDIRLCDWTDATVGNIQRQDLAAVWHQEQTRSSRRELVRCEKPCVYCMRRGLRDYMRVLLAYTKS